MAEMAGKVDEREEFWRPPKETAGREYQRPVAAQMESCQACGADLVIGSRFCHVCGTGRYERMRPVQREWTRWFDIRRWRDAVGLPISSIIALSLGVVCGIIAIATGLVYTASTVLDWQAVQIWRIEWLLAASAAFLAGILLKDRKA